MAERCPCCGYQMESQTYTTYNTGPYPEDILRARIAELERAMRSEQWSRDEARRTQWRRP